jgi:D-alanyl-lipoteichoic acid acyltransferase DltB (MBOAT superfamily)
MSLTTWFRDFLFLPFAYYLSGKMVKSHYFKIRTELLIYIISILLTFFLCGLWHGAAINFIIWGGLHGIALAIHKFIHPKVRANKKIPPLRLFISRFFTFHFIVFTWIIFRITSAEGFSILIRKILFQFHAELAGQIISAYRKELILLVAGFLLIWAPSKIKEDVKRSFVAMPEYAKGIIVVCVIFFIYQFKVSGIQPFIYFQF